MEHLEIVSSYPPCLSWIPLQNRKLSDTDKADLEIDSCSNRAHRYDGSLFEVKQQSEDKSLVVADRKPLTESAAMKELKTTRQPRRHLV